MRCALAVFFAVVLPTATSAAGFDDALYADLLLRHTREVKDTARVRVDYAGLARSAAWRRLVAGLADAQPTELRTRDEKLAFWINTYNVLALDLVVRNHPVDSIRDIGSFLSPVWKRKAGIVGGAPRTLDEIEHIILRPMGEPRIHVAIVCASVSCPALQRKPWTSTDLDAQFTSALEAFLADPEKGLRIDTAGGTVYLSRIFDWFAQDFDRDGGVIAFVQRSAPASARDWLKTHASATTVRYFDYDWSVNDLANAG